MFSSSVDSRQLLHLPIWLKYVVVGVLATSFLVSVGLCVHYIGQPDNSDVILLALGTLQFVATAMAAVVMLLFSQTDSTIVDLEARTSDFLVSQLPRFLGRMTFPGMVSAQLTVSVGERTDLFGRTYVIEDGPADARQFRMAMWCGVNVKRIILIFFVRCNIDRTAEQSLETVQDVFRFTMKGAESIAYKVPYEPLAPGLDGAANGVSIWATVQVETDFLTNPSAKLFWAQDIAMMAQSALRTAMRSGQVDFDPGLMPAPL